MKALTLTQPWATLVILGIKKWETRGWFPPAAERGRILIHAAKGWRADDRELADIWFRDGTLPVPRELLPLGAILGTVRIDGLIRTDPPLVAKHISAFENTLGNYDPGRYAWELGDPQPLADPIPWKGALGLWAGPDLSALPAAGSPR